jgi:uncharacterized protein YciI
VQFEDKAGTQDIRAQFFQAHLGYLVQFKDMILASGPLRLEQGEAAIGGLWIVKANSAKEIEAIIDQDPFWINGLRASRRILHWAKTDHGPVVL